LIEDVEASWFGEGGLDVIHRGIQYTIVATAEPDIWEWRYELGAAIKTGRTQTKLAALAARRVRCKIDVALRTQQAAPPSPRVEQAHELTSHT
jgi:hypothetical protein